MSPDLLIAIGQVFLTVGAILMLANRNTHIDPRLSLPSAASLGLVSLGLLMLSAPISAAVAAVGAAAWLGIFTIRGRDPNLSR